MVNMWREDSMIAAAKKRGERNMQKYWWKRAKPVMRLTTFLWLITSLFGIVTYAIRYDVLSLPSLNETTAPVATEEPEVTEEAPVCFKSVPAFS